MKESAYDKRCHKTRLRRHGRERKETFEDDYGPSCARDERGTILKVSPDFRRREIVCTGIRFPVALAFNAAGDLFCTDQEGATWLPNGNPFDELLHIQPGRHYGFPPRHPKYLPDVIDEPSTFDYAPQHESTCGLHFNEPVGGGNQSGYRRLSDQAPRSYSARCPRSPWPRGSPG